MDQIVILLAQYGLLLVFSNVLLAQLGLPLPAVPTLIVAGALVRDGQLCRVSMEPDSCVKQTETIYERWGAPSLMFAKFVPGFSTVAPPVAGAMRLGLPSFLGYSAVGALLWAGVAVALGMLFHTQVDRLLQWLSDMGALAFTVLALTVGFYMAAKWVERWLFVRLMRMARITVDELKALMQGNDPFIVLDARSSVARKVDPRRIPGAVAVDLAAPEHVVGGVTPAHHIVVYCS
jgi:membrane protein DedA with SNARE-associated domain